MNWKRMPCPDCGRKVTWLRPSACICPWCAQQRIAALEAALNCTGPCPVCGDDGLCPLHTKLWTAEIPTVRHSDEAWRRKLEQAERELAEERARLKEAKRILLNIIRVNGGSPLDEEAALAAIDAARRAG